MEEPKIYRPTEFEAYAARCGILRAIDHHAVLSMDNQVKELVTEERDAFHKWRSKMAMIKELLKKRKESKR